MRQEKKRRRWPWVLLIAAALVAVQVSAEVMVPTEQAVMAIALISQAVRLLQQEAHTVRVSEAVGVAMAVTQVMEAPKTPINIS